MASNKGTKRDQPLISYKLSENNEELESLNNAFDILFEETLKKDSYLTTNDN